MDQQHAEQIGGSTSAGPKAQWVRPEVDRFAAGSAEAADINNTDGAQTS